METSLEILGGTEHVAGIVHAFSLTLQHVTDTISFSFSPTRANISMVLKYIIIVAMH